MRAAFNVLVLPYRKRGQEIAFCLFQRADLGIWQFVAGGGEEGEDFLTAAKRESHEEGGISYDSKYISLETMGHVSADNFSPRARAHWGKKYVIPVYTFAVEATAAIRIGREHTQYRWCNYDEARESLRFDLDKTALYELNERLKDEEF